MQTIAIVIFCVCALLIAHTYVIYPLLLKLISSGKKENGIVFSKDELPDVIIMMAVYNEQKVIAQKIESILNANYPKEKLQLWIGSDNSTDNTNAIIEGFTQQHSLIKFFPFSERNGKTGIINALKQKIDVANSNSILILTDANVFFEKDCILNLCKHFKNKEIGQVGANILNSGIKTDGISEQEKTYIQRENSIKYIEGLFGKMQGAFGGCYAIRASLLPEVPANFFMEDFYISMTVLKTGSKAIFAKDAVCYEDVSNEVSEEFKRKTRISIGNFQNLIVFWPLLFRFDLNAFFFLSHKVLRWKTPFLLIFCLISSFLLMRLTLFKALFALQLLLISFPLVDLLLKRVNIHISWLRLIGYFYMMNLALLVGFFKFLKGVESSAWTPTKRNI